MKMRYKCGDTLFREGDPSDFACLILDGTVEVRRNIGDESVALGELAPGDLAGEMGVLENQPRSATVAAKTDVVVEVVAGEQFLDWISARPDVARRLLVRQSSRVRVLTAEVGRLHQALRTYDPNTRTMAERLADHPAASQPPAVSSQAGLSSPTPPQFVPSCGASPVPAFAAAPPPPRPAAVAIRCVGAAGDQKIMVTGMPFRVGRRAPEIGQLECDAQTLVVEDKFPFRVSPNHFAICDDPKLGLVVRDLGSDLGTTVNGQFLGGIFAKDTCRLQSGVNTIVAGGLDSPFVFKVTMD